MVMSRNYFVLVISLGFLQLVTFRFPANSKCPTSNGLMKRVGNTRYFIFHNPRGKTDKYYNWAEAKKMCSELKGFKMATVEKLTTFAELGRALEKLVTKFSFLDTWYWLDAKYDNEKQMYIWGGDKSRPLKFTNFFYRYPRPTGLAGFIDAYKTYQINKTTEQCLTLALPYPAAYNMKPATNRGGMIYGFSATFDEKPCAAKKTIHAICESTLPECTQVNTDPFTISEDKDSYFDDGGWGIGGFRYIVNFKQKTQTESEEYCRSRNLTLFNPISKESDLIPHLKMWSRGITVSQFWTNWTYHVNQPGNGLRGEFKNADGKIMATVRAFANVTNIEELETRSNKYDKVLCVAMQVSAEFKGSQYPCPSKHESACNWNFIQYVPANCNNFHGTICELVGQDSTDRAVWKKKWIKNLLEFLNDADQFALPFGYDTNANTLSSGFKQTFGSLVCPQDFHMPRINDTKWHKQRIVLRDYNEYLESFWVVDDEGFKKDVNSKCALSTPVGDGFVRAIKMVPCTEWHFYICDRVVRPIKKKEYKLPYEVPTSVSWDDHRFERKYPIL